MKKIAFYGKGGIGKSTTVSNISAALTKLGFTVMQIGCDPKADSTIGLTGGKHIDTILSLMRDHHSVTLEEIVFKSDTGVLCVEAGGPVPGTGCAGRGIITAFEVLDHLNAYQVFQPDVVLFDVLGDVVCGGFAMPIRQGFADEVYIITSGEMMSLFAASNIASAVENFGKYGYAMLKGLILNRRNVENEADLTLQAAIEMNTSVIHTINRSPVVQQAEALGKTVVEAFPDDDMTKHYIALAQKLMEGYVR